MSYNANSMVSQEDIKKIHKELERIGSKVSSSCLDNREHSLSNIMSLACSGGTYGITIHQMSEIKQILKDSYEIEINYSCEGSITGPRT